MLGEKKNAQKPPHQLNLSHHRGIMGYHLDGKGPKHNLMKTRMCGELISRDQLHPLLHKLSRASLLYYYQDFFVTTEVQKKWGSGDVLRCCASTLKRWCTEMLNWGWIEVLERWGLGYLSRVGHVKRLAAKKCHFFGVLTSIECCGWGFPRYILYFFLLVWNSNKHVFFGPFFRVWFFLICFCRFGFRHFHFLAFK